MMKCWIILITCLLWQSLTLSVEFAGGTGEPNDPYQIVTAEQLVSIGLNDRLLEKHYILIEDIDLDPNLPNGRVFTDALIAPDDSSDLGGYSGPFFGGVLDGQGHTITNLHIEGRYGYAAGLFGRFSGLVKDLHLSDVAVSGSPCGAIAGNNDGMMLRCSVTGHVSGSTRVGGLAGDSGGSLVECQAHVQVTAGNNVGGMVGMSQSGGASTTLMRCKAQVDVIGQQNVGGLIGNSLEGQITECSMTGTVIGNENVGGLIGKSMSAIILRSSANCEITAEQTAGGLVGHAIFGLMLADCYSQGSIVGSTVGGSVGESGTQIINCYAACKILSMEAEGTDSLVGGLFGDTTWTPTTIACFWDAEYSGIAVSTGSDLREFGTGLSTEQMMGEDVFHDAGWDFSHVWTISEGDYPRLQWETQRIDIEHVLGQSLE